MTEIGAISKEHKMSINRL